jgi:hypothetical protein
MNRWERLKLAIEAGLGAVCFMIFYYRFLRFRSGSFKEAAESFLAFFLVFIFIVVFLEPFIERLRRILHLPEEHYEAPRGKLFLRILAVSIVMATGILHGMLHEQIMANPQVIVALMITALICCGSITYCWTMGVKRRPFKAKYLGAFSGFLVGAGVYIFICALFPKQEVCQLTREGMIIVLIANGLSWAFLGFAGGLAIDLGWGSRPGLILLFLFGAIMLQNLLIVLQEAQDLAEAAKMMGWSNIRDRAALDTMKVLGWGFGLWANPNTYVLDPSRIPEDVPEGAWSE